LAAKVLIIDRLPRRLKVFPSSLLLLATTSEKVFLVFALPTTKTTLREEEEAQEEEENKRISFLSLMEFFDPKVSSFALLRFGFI